MLTTEKKNSWQKQHGDELQWLRRQWSGGVKEIGHVKNLINLMFIINLQHTGLHCSVIYVIVQRPTILHDLNKQLFNIRKSFA